MMDTSELKAEITVDASQFLKAIRKARRTVFWWGIRLRLALFFKRVKQWIFGIYQRLKK